MRLHLAIIMTSFFLLSNSYAANTLNDPAALTVTLQQDCAGYNNCSDTTVELIDWIHNTRIPSASRPLLVEIGPGKFVMGKTQEGSTELAALPLCQNSGYITFRGAGRKNTILTGYGGMGGGASNGLTHGGVIAVTDCVNMVFESFTVEVSTTYGPDGDLLHGVLWSKGGNSIWNNVEIKADMYAWADRCPPGTVGGQHEWYGSSLVASNTTADGYYNITIRSVCGTTKFYGGEIIAMRSNTGTAAAALVAVVADGADAKIEIYGSLVRSINMNPNANYNNHNTVSSVALGHGGIVSRNGSSVHMHGGIISVLSDGNSSVGNVFGVKANNDGSIHTPDTAFGLKASGSGSAERIIDEGGKIQSPFQWPSNSTPPEITSVTGADTFIENDCGLTGCQPGGSDPHMLIYSANCNTAGNWFDTVTNACRVE